MTLIKEKCFWSRHESELVLSFTHGSWYPWDANFYLFSSTADPMLAEASLSTAHGSSHGLVPHVQYSEHYASPDIHTHHHSATSTIFTPGGSLATDPYLISGPGPCTVTQEEPIDEVMMPDKSDGPDSYCCSCLLVWNSVKDYWERLYGSGVYSITKLLVGMLLWKVKVIFTLKLHTT